MKYIITLMYLLCTSLAWAEPLAWLPNASGGKIIITSDPCTMPQLRSKEVHKVLGYSAEGTLIHGCWGAFKYDDSFVAVIWSHSQDDLQIYPWSEFRPMNTTKPTGRSM